MADEEKKEKKIITDEDWKAEARKEKEKLAKEEAEKKTEEPEEEVEGRELPRGDINGLMSMLVTQAYFAMGLLQTEGSEQEPDFQLARYHIDLLEALEEKTKGNLSEQEGAVLSSTLNQLRMAYVKLAS